MPCEAPDFLTRILDKVSIHFRWPPYRNLLLHPLQDNVNHNHAFHQAKGEANSLGCAQSHDGLCNLQVRFSIPDISITASNKNRIRHVKCDEAKPHCNRCKRNELECQGYVFVPDGRRGPKKKKSLKIDTRLGDHGPDSSLFHQLASNNTTLPTESELCNYVRIAVVEDLARAIIPTAFWQQYAMPLSQASSPVQHALHALGTAHRRFRFQPSTPDTVLPGVSLEEASIQQYNQAIHHITNLLHHESQENLEVIVMCCIIFICIENLLGRPTEARKHWKAGCSLFIRLRQQCAEKVGTNQSGGMECSANTKLLRQMALLLSKQGQDVVVFSGCNTVPEMVLNRCVRIDSADPQTRFDSVEAATEALLVLEASFFEWEFCYGKRTDLLGDGPESSLDFAFPNDPLPKNACSAMDFAAKLEDWAGRFDTLQNKTTTESKSPQATYQVQNISLCQAAWSGYLDMVTRSDCVSTKFSDDILTMVESLIDHEAFSSAPTYYFSGNIIPSIVFAYRSSADAELRTRALDLLRSINLKEGLWDSQEVAHKIEAGLL